MLLADFGGLRPTLVLLVPVERLPLGMRGRRTDAISSSLLLGLVEGFVRFEEG